MTTVKNLLRTSSSLFLRLASLSALLMVVTACVPGQDNGNGVGGPPTSGDCDQSKPHHRHPEWGDNDSARNQKDWDDAQGFHHHEWDDNKGKHHHEWCDDHGNHNHDYDDDSGNHHHDWNDDHGHDSHDYDDSHGHHHDGDDNHTSTSTSTAVATPCHNTATSTATSTTSTTSTATSTAVFTFPDLPGRTCTVDKFQQAADSGTQYVKKLDLLFVMDHSGSMSDDWQRVATNIENLVKQLPSTTDIRYAVLLGDVGAWSGRLYSPFGATYLDNQKMTTAQIAQALQQTFAAGMKVSDAGSGEALFYSLYKAATTQAVANQKAGFFRPDAALSVLFMSDEQEIGFPFPSHADLSAQGLPVRCDETFEDGVKKQYYDQQGVNLDATWNAVKALKGSMPIKMNAFINITKADLFTNNSSNAKCLYDSIGYGYPDMVAKTNGVLYSIEADKAAGLTQCGQAIAATLALQHDFPLSQPAKNVDPATILNAVDGQYVTGTYDAVADSEHLDNAGAAGSVIQIRYCAPNAAIAWNLTNFAGVPSQTSVGLSWNTSEYATNGKVMWGTSASALTNEADETAKATNHSVTVSGLSPNTVYYFQATSSDEFGVSKSSPVLSFRTNPDWTITNVVAQAARTSASLSWTTAEYATKGHVLWGTDGSALTNQTADTGTANAQSIALSGLSPSTTYYYQVVASDEFGLSKSSAVMSFTTQADWGIFGLAGAATRTTVALEWSTPDQVTTGTIFYGRSAALGTTVPEGASAANNHAVTVSGLTPDTDYYFQAVATDPSGQVKYSNMILVHTAVDWNMTGFAGVSTQTAVTVSWTTPGYATSGTVLYGSSGTALSSSAIDSANGTSHSVTVNGLNANTVYYFQAVSVDSDGVQKASSVVAISTQPIPLPTWSITNFAGTSTTSSVSLNWNTTQYATSGYVLYGASLDAVNVQVNDSVTGTSHSVNVTGLTADTIYYFQAVSTDDRGQTQSSDVIQVRTMANTVVTPPSNWVITGFDGTTTATQADLIWQTTGAQTKATVMVGTSATDLTLMQLDVTTFAETQQLAVPGLTPNTQYFFQVTATDSSGRTVESVVISKTTKAQ